MKVGIVLPVINLWTKYTLPCLNSLKSKHELYTVLVDNGSTDETLKEASARVGDHFVHRRYEINQGVQESWNWGIAECFEKGYEYVFIINNDTLFQSEAIDRLVDRFEKAKKDEPTIVMITCQNMQGRISPDEIFDEKPAKHESTAEAESPDFSAFMINKKCWSEVGKFDRGYFPAYYEDSDYHRRIKLAGLTAISHPPSVYYHFGSRTQLEAIGRPLTDSGISHAYFIKKWGGDIEPSGKLVDRLWPTPFNDSKKDMKWTLQDAHGIECTCDSSCMAISARFRKYPN